MNDLLLAKGKEPYVITYVAVKLLKISFYNNFHVSDVTTTLPLLIIYQHLQMWPANESASNKNLQTEHKYKMHLMCAIFFCSTVLDEVLG